MTKNNYVQLRYNIVKKKKEYYDVKTPRKETLRRKNQGLRGTIKLHTSSKSLLITSIVLSC